MAALLSGSSREVKKLMLGITPPHLPQHPASSDNAGSVGRNPHDSEVEAASSQDIARALEGKRFRLGYFQVPSSSYDRWWSDDKQQGGESVKKYQPWNQREPYQQHMSYGLQLVSPDQADTGSVRLTVKDPPTLSSSSTQPETTQNLSLVGKLFVKTKQSLKRVLPSNKDTTSSVSERRPAATTNLLPVVFLVLVTGLLILILYYENTILDTPFERFMDSQTYGVRFLFTAMGTGITTFWDYYFSCGLSLLLCPFLSLRSRLTKPLLVVDICEKQHFSQLQAAAPNPPDSIDSAATSTTNLSAATTPTNPTTAPAPPTDPTLSPRKTPTATTTINTILSPIPSTELHALYHAFSRREAQPKDRLTLASVSMATFLSKFAPILLSGVPFRNTVTWKMHETYTWTLVCVLSYMVLVLGVLLLPRAVPLYLLGRFRKNAREDTGIDGRQLAPTPPTSIAGYMYYVCDSHMLRDFEGLSTASRKARDKAVLETNNSRGHEGDNAGGRGYFMGTLTGVSGVNRVGIDYIPVSR